MKTLTGHGTIILAIMYAALLIADHYNPTMDFVNNNVTKALILILCLFAVYHAILTLSRERARVRRREEKKREALRARRAAEAGRRRL
jgi:succinate dehydrogenase hydrophobic anchor subunit